MTKKTDNQDDSLSDIEQRRDSLRNEIENISAKLQQINEEIEKAEQKKTKAKAAYNTCLDAGDEKGMSQALAAVRESNTEREKQIAKLISFDAEISGLRSAQEKLVPSARGFITEAQKKIEDAKKEFDTVDSCCKSCLGILGYINELDNEFTRIKDRFVPTEKTKRAEPEVASNVRHI